MKRLALPLVLLGAMLAAMIPGRASAQFLVTFVSRTGDDASGSCSQNAPCQTFERALGALLPGGELVCLDSSIYTTTGTITITQAVTISCEGVDGFLSSEGGPSSSVVINAGPDDVVVLRGLDIQGGNLGSPNGIQFNSGGALYVLNCRINGVKGADPNGWGIQFAPTGSAELVVSDTSIINNGAATSGGGVLVKAAPGKVTKAVLNHVALGANFFGIKADGSGAANGVINMTVRDSVSTGNHSNGIVGTTNAGGAAIVMMIDRSTSSHNAAGFGVIADGPKTTIRLGGSSITGNPTGVGMSNGGTLQSFRTNQIKGNSIDGTPLPAVGLD